MGEDGPGTSGYIMKEEFFASCSNECGKQREHEHTAECIAWAPDTAAAPFNKTAGADKKKGTSSRTLFCLWIKLSGSGMLV